MQNRKSAKKCRLKKKAEFNCLKDDIEATIRENGELKIKVRKPPNTSFYQFIILSSTP